MPCLVLSRETLNILSLVVLSYYIKVWLGLIWIIAVQYTVGTLLQEFIRR